MFAAILLGSGAVLGSGGLELLLLGGSAYYLLAGIALLASGVLLWQGRRRGLWVYGALLLATIAWSLWETGADGWSLASRSGFFLVLGAYLLLPHARRALS
jgi:glucose dehydrogenase